MSYNVPGARWMPSYVLRVADDFKTGRMHLRSTIIQNTGEDWLDAMIRLSTARLGNWTELPKLASRRIGRVQGVRRSGWFPPPSDTSDLFADYDRFFNPVFEEEKAEIPKPSETILEKPEKPSDISDTVPIKRKDSPKSGTPRLITLSEQLRGRTFELTKDFHTCGRDASQDICINDPTISSHHCDFVKRGKSYYICDRGSTNGTRVNNVPVQEQELQNSDILQVGGVELLYDVDDKSVSTVVRTQTGINLGAGDLDVSTVTRMKNFSPYAVAREKPGLFHKALSSTQPSYRSKAKSLSVRSIEEEQIRINNYLNYNSLRMFSANNKQRGEIQIVDRVATYLEVLVEHSVTREWIVDLMENSSKAALRTFPTLPKGCFKVGSWQGFDYVYDAAAPVDIPSDACFHSVPVCDFQVDFTLVHVAVPSLSQHVYRVLRLTTPARFALLKGGVDVYLGSNFLLSSTIESTPPECLLEIGIGVEQDIKIARNVIFREENSGLLHGYRALDHDVTIEIANNLPCASSMEVRERLPTGDEKTKKIKVKLKSAEPAWEPFEMDDGALMGGHCWKLTIPTRGRSTLSYSYSIVISAKEELADGNRRDS